MSWNVRYKIVLACIRIHCNAMLHASGAADSQAIHFNDDFALGCMLTISHSRGVTLNILQARGTAGTELHADSEGIFCTMATSALPDLESQMSRLTRRVVNGIGYEIARTTPSDSTWLNVFEADHGWIVFKLHRSSALASAKTA